jgi:DNA repair exonuclease SbcCD ATPase subunit
VSARLEQLDEAVATLRNADTATRLHADVEAIRSRLETDDASLSELRAAAEELAARPAGDPELAARLASLSARVDELAAQTAAATEAAGDATQVEQLGAAVTSAQGELEAAVAGIVARLEALETAPPPSPVEIAAAADTAWTAEAANLAERLDALTARMDEGLPAVPAAGAAAPPPPRRAAVPGEPGDETEQELERLRMAIERMSLHLGEQERAIAEVMRSRGVAQRLDELEARIDDVAAGVPVAGGAPAAGGTGAPANANGEVRALARRLDSAEAALEAERDKLLTKLERIASSLDWRMRRLEAGDDPGA